MSERRPDGRERAVVVVGASAGGVEALKQLVRGLPAGFRAAVLVVLHVPPTGTSVLPQILERAGPLPASHARDGEALEGARIYVAPPDFHLLVESDALGVVRGPKENGARPAIDPLFRTAARAYGERVAGVILSGSLDDGTAGLAAVKQAGGLTLVQDPAEALYPGMPSSAIDLVGPDHVLAVAEIASLLADGAGPNGPDDDAQSRREQMSEDLTQLPPDAVYERNESTGARSAFTCPECSGLLWELRDGEVVKFRCRVGHAYTEETLLMEQSASLEAALWTALTALEEKADFARRLAERMSRTGNELSARRYEDQARNAREQADHVRRAVLAFDSGPGAREEHAS